MAESLKSPLCVLLVITTRSSFTATKNVKSWKGKSYNNVFNGTETIHYMVEKGYVDSVKEGIRLGIDYSQTVSCYQADQKGKACGKCASCRLRSQGFEQAGISDPTRYQ